jgi:U4/U6.U5 tri-snRNP component SNU23
MSTDGVEGIVATSSGRTWDRGEAERKYAERLAREKAEEKEAKSKKAGMGKLPPPASTASDSVQARTEAIIKPEELHGKRELAAPILGRSKKGKSAGFYCEACDLTFKDSLSYLDHINSSQRMISVRVLLILDYRKLGLSGASDVGTSAESACVVKGTKD